MNYFLYFNKIVIFSIFGFAITAAFLYILIKILFKKNLFKSIPPKEIKHEEKILFVDLSPKTKNVVDLAVEVWRLNSRIKKISDNLSDIQKRGLESSTAKFQKFLDTYKINILDYTGEKYNEGMNVDVISFEKDESVKFPLVKETVEPSILCDGQIIKKGKIIVINK